MWTDPAVNDVEKIMADIDAKYNAALADVDPALVDLYVLPEGVTAERTGN
jgi:multiple sugar transport system substrate-binding protein